LAARLERHLGVFRRSLEFFVTHQFRPFASLQFSTKSKGSLRLFREDIPIQRPVWSLRDSELIVRRQIRAFSRPFFTVIYAGGELD